MVDFSQYLKRPAGHGKKAPALPPGDYPGIVKGWGQVTEAKFGFNQGEPVIPLQLALTGYPELVTSEEQEALGPLSDRRFTKEYSLVEKKLHELDTLLRSCGLAADENNEKPYEEMLPMVIGANVIITVRQFLNQTTNELGNGVSKVVGVG